MSRLDDLLRQALEPEDPGPDFTRRVLERAAQAPAPGRWRRFASLFHLPRPALAVMAATACVLLAIGGLQIRERREQAQGEAAKQQVVQALRIAGAKLSVARQTVLELQGAGPQE
jgi:hypothetical protein